MYSGHLYLYVLHQAFVAIVLPGDNSSCRVYVGNDVEQYLSLGVRNGEGCDGYYESRINLGLAQTLWVWILTATLVSKD